MIQRRRAQLCQLIPILVLLIAANLDAQTIKVAVMGIQSTPAFNQDVQHKLMSTRAFQLVDILDVSADGIPPLPKLQRYDAILVYAAADVSTTTAESIGNLLASYFESGGGVVDMVSIQGEPLGGRWRSAGYSLLTSSGTVAGEQLRLGSVDPATTLLRGVTKFDGGLSSYHSLGQPINGGSVVAQWTNNAPLVIAGTVRGFPRVTLNFFPVSNDVREDFWVARGLPSDPAVPNGARLMANALTAVVQSPRPPENCAITIAPSSITSPAQLSVRFIAVALSDPACSYTATSDASWVTPIPRIGQGDDLGLIVDQNMGAARSTTVHVANRDLVVNQAAGNVPGFNFGQDLTETDSNRAVSGVVTVNAGSPALTWTAVSDAPWIHITSATPQTGSGTVSYNIDLNTGLRRTGTMTIAGLTYVITQGGAPCYFTLNSTSTARSAVGEAVRIDVTASFPGCPWTATSDSSFLTITSGSTGIGDGSVNFSIAPNPSASPRVGTLKIAMQTFTVTQEGQPAVVTINPSSADFATAGGPGAVALTVTPPDATWTNVRSNVPWVTFTSDTAGRGSANLTYLVAANPGAARSGTLTILGKTFTVNQAGVSNGFTLAPLSANFDAVGGSRSVNVAQTGAPSAWSATSDVAWITITAGSNGFGNGTVNYTVAANPGANVRTGSMTIAGNAFNVTQSGNGGPSAGSRFVPVIPCRIADTRNAVGPYGGPILAGGVRRTFSVTAANCGIPASAQAFSLNITAVPNGPLGFLTAWPAGQPQPLVSTLNSGDGRVVANAAIVPSGAGGGVDIFVTDNSHVVIDINGYFDSQNAAALPFFTVTPCRVADTRNPNGPFGGPALVPNVARSFNLPAGPCGIPASAQAYSLNATAVPSGPLGFLTLWPSSQPQPQVSTLNSFDGRIVANAAIVSAGASGAVSAFAAGTTNLVLDTNGYFGPTGNTPALSFFPITPCRVADTRSGNGPFGGPFVAAGGTRAFAIPQSNCGVPANASAYSLNITAVPRGILQFLTIWPADRPQPLVSTLNSFQGAIVANAAIVPAAADGSVKVFTSEASDVVIDINGYFASRQ